MERLHELAALARRHMGDRPAEGVGPVLAPGLQLIVSSGLTAGQQLVYEPMLCLIVEGGKRSTLGSETYDYRAGEYLVVSAELPVSGQVIEAPYLAIGIPLDPNLIAELMLDMQVVHDPTPQRALAVCRMEDEMVDAVLRLLRLLDRPEQAGVLAPLIQREIVWRLLSGERGGAVRQIASGEGRVTQVNKVIRWIRSRYAEPLRVEELADMVGMSETSLFRHFRAVTAMSPLQYQKQIRLQEARTLLLTQAHDVAGVGFAVGYNNPSQFSREYSRLFGLPPGRDADRLRADPALAVAV
ncbi:AraC family transcriptional regulator N-terminal domain-containing protein [Brevundimonas sp. VNH65]|uniref:AraC family transcriptional regulator n=1 Tax=Brevundimonas sp. VNH65 TaxID=3400917 RepID=UPI003C00C616